MSSREEKPHLWLHPQRLSRQNATAVAPSQLGLDLYLSFLRVEDSQHQQHLRHPRISQECQNKA